MKVNSQSLSLSIDMNTQTIIGHLELFISQSMSEMCLNLQCLQQEIISVYCKNQDIDIKIIQTPKTYIQANCLKNVVPSSIDYYFQLLEKAQNDTQILKIQIQNQKLQDLKLIIKYKIVQPIAGIKFLRNLRTNFDNFKTKSSQEDYFFTDNLDNSAKNWIPQLNEKTLIKTIKIVCDKKYLCICSGQLLEQEESENQIAFIYKIDQTCNWEKIGIVVGEFLFEKHDNLNLWLYYPLKIHRRTQRLQQTFNLITEISKFTENYKPQFFQQTYSLVVLPFVKNSMKEIIPQSYINLGIINESSLIFEYQVKNTVQKRDVFKTINMSLLVENILIQDSESKWILYGLNGFLSDQFITQNECEQKIMLTKSFDKLIKLVQKGKEIFPVHYQKIQYQESDKVFQLKSRLLIHMLTSIANCKKSLAKILIQKNVSLSTQSFIKLIQQSFGVKKMKYFKKQFIYSTGLPILKVTFNFSRRENNLQFYIEQNQVHKEVIIVISKFYEEQTKIRQKIEMKYNNQVSEPLNSIMLQKKMCIPEITKSLEYYWGKLNLTISETNDIDYKEEEHQINLEQKRESKMAISCRGKFRKTINQKRYGEEQESQFDVSVSQTDRKNTNPALWIKIDQENQYLKQIDLNQSETLLLIQLTKENNSIIIYSILRQLEYQPSQMVVNTLCELIDQKEFEPILLNYIAQIMLKMSSPNTSWHGLNKLINILKQNLIKDEMVISNDFSKKSLYFFNKTIIKEVSKLKDQKMFLDKYIMSDQNNQLFLKLLQQNDNSIQQYSDSHYRALLIKSLLNSNNPLFVKKILQEIFCQLQSEVAMISENHIITKTVLKGLVKYINRNDINQNSFSLNQEIQNIQQKLKILLNKSDPLIYSIYFYYKIQLKEYYYQWSKQKVLIYSLQKIEKKSILIQELLAHVLQKYVFKNKIYFQQTFQLQESKEKNKIIAELLWEQLTSGQSFINSIYREAFIRIYRLFYFHYSPPCFPIVYFQIDLNWIFNINNEHSIRSANIVNLRCLNLNKRKRNQLEKTKINPRDILMTYFKNSGIENINWKTLSRAILQVISQEKNTEQIEKERLQDDMPQFDESQNPENGEIQVVKIKVKTQLSMKQIKRRLQREYYENIDQVEEEVYEVINNYRNRGLLNEMAYNEYQELVECMFQESRQICQDKSSGKISVKICKIPKIKLNIEGNQASFNNGEKERQLKLMEKEKLEYLKKKGTNTIKFQLNKQENK